ncbi:hypothetical protein [Streptomyces sp. NBC_00102]|uniref:hypothetical protein n=1 Tax=Streptomyces sp. NBC_00102 TaxID=2975652 RepID=UPI00224D0532|nr:hypothetical protein [Streptomyces sp. NBC_00102]
MYGTGPAGAWTLATAVAGQDATSYQQRPAGATRSRGRGARSGADPARIGCEGYARPVVRARP